MSKTDEEFSCCMDCGPDVVAKCKTVGCQVDDLVAQEQQAVQEAMDKARRAPWPFTDTTSSSTFTKSLQRSQRAEEASRRRQQKTPMFEGWSIGKTDPNIRFEAENRRNFGTRKPRQKT